jgi:hypothetical protein
MLVTRSPELEQLAADGRQAADRRDEEWRAQHTADGEVVSFGSDPQEIWRGRDAVLGLTSAQVNEVNDSFGLKYEQDSVEGYEAGDAGFVIIHGRFLLADGSSFPTRAVNFLVKDGDQWQSVCGGLSLLVRNELMTAGSPLAETAGPA